MFFPAVEKRRDACFFFEPVGKIEFIAEADELRNLRDFRVRVFQVLFCEIQPLPLNVLWGYYGALQFVGLFGWDKETRYDHAYFAVLPLDWTAFALLIGLMILTYVIGKYIFSRKEF